MGGFAGLGGIAAVTAVAVTGPEVYRYPITETVARERLASTPLPEPLLAFAGNKAALVREDGALVWNLGDAGNRSVGRVTLNATALRPTSPSASTCPTPRWAIRRFGRPA